MKQILLLKRQIQNLFKTNNITLAIAESCTGGEIASRLTKIPGSSEYFWEVSQRTIALLKKKF